MALRKSSLAKKLCQCCLYTVKLADQMENPNHLPISNNSKCVVLVHNPFQHGHCVLVKQVQGNGLTGYQHHSRQLYDWEGNSSPLLVESAASNILQIITQILPEQGQISPMSEPLHNSFGNFCLKFTPKNLKKITIKDFQRPIFCLS